MYEDGLYEIRLVFYQVQSYLFTLAVALQDLERLT